LLAEADDEFDRMWEELRHVPLPCERCGNDLRDDGSRDVLLGCGACDATICAVCSRIWASMGPAFGEHSMCGMLGHLTLAEQPKFAVAVKRR
jgi:hypothetical protein